jgi:membrane-associated phospholipid phosphatase
LRIQRYTELVVAFYLLVTAGLVLASRQLVPNWERYVLLHLAICGAIVLLRYVPEKLPAPLQFIRDWYPVPLFLFFYKEVEVFAASFGNWSLTGLIRQVEVILFHGHPSLYLSEIYDWVALSEYLHFCYFFHNIQIPLIGGYWYLTRRPVFREMLFLLCATLCLSYLFYILFPVDSPFYLAEPPGAPLAGHFFYELVHFVSERGGARGGAFPSSHVSVSLIIWLTAWYRQRNLAYGLAPITAGLILATVYGRFHYVLDLVAGFALAFSVIGFYRYFLKDRIADGSFLK